jgi:NTE family protein
MRLSVGAVNVKSGNIIYFDNRTNAIGPEHVMASASMPPGFPPTEIDGNFYWDGGLISNTPLQWVLGQNKTHQDTLAFQVDLWPAQGSIPKNLSEVAMRQKEIQYSSRTRAGTSEFMRIQGLRASLANILAKLPAELKDTEDAARLKEAAGHQVYNIVHLIYRTRHYESHSKDYEFSRLSMQEHWRAGYQDAVCTLNNPDIFKRPKNQEGVGIFDICKE